MIEMRNLYPKNRHHFFRLIEFCQDVLAVCDELGIQPVLSGSLAVFAYTRDRAMAVNDVDLACSEREFPRLGQALEAKGIVHELRPWHVLQTRKGDLKVEFDSMEHWMADLPEGCDTLMIGDRVFTVVGLPALTELYRRGLEATACQGHDGNRTKHAAISQKHKMLCSLVCPRGQRPRDDPCSVSEVADKMDGLGWEKVDV